MNYVFLDHGIRERIEACGGSIAALDAPAIPIAEAQDAEIEAGSRGVLLSSVPSGIVARHLRLFCQLSQISHWVIALIDVDVPAVRNQAVNECNEAFSQLPAFHEFVFDAPSLENLRAALARPQKRGSQLIVASRNASLAERVADLLREGMDGWELIPARSVRDAYYADAALIVGAELEDFAVLSPETHIAHRFAWLDRRWPDTPDARKRELNALRAALNEGGWRVGEVLASSLANEEAAARLRAGECSAVTLKNDPDFAMWDEYGLPALPEQYTQQGVAAFLQANSCFSDLRDRLMQTTKERGVVCEV